MTRGRYCEGKCEAPCMRISQVVFSISYMKSHQSTGYIERHHLRRTMNELSPLKLTDAQNGYLSGILDGEGYIGLCKSSKNRYLLRVVITSTCNELVSWIHTTTKLGKVTFRDLSHRQRQNVYEWKAFGAE